MAVKLLVWLALALSLGQIHGDYDQPRDDVMLVDVENVDAPELVVTVAHLVRPVSREGGELPPLLVSAPGSRDAGRVFRPPRFALG